MPEVSQSNVSSLVATSRGLALPLAETVKTSLPSLLGSVLEDQEPGSPIRILLYFARWIESLKYPEWRVEERNELAQQFHRIGEHALARRLLIMSDHDLLSAEGKNKELMRCRASQPVAWACIGDLKKALEVFCNLKRDGIEGEFFNDYVSSLCFHLQETLEKKLSTHESLRALALALELRSIPEPSRGDRVKVERPLLLIGLMCGQLESAELHFDRLFPNWDFSHTDIDANWCGSLFADMLICGAEQYPSMLEKMHQCIERYVPLLAQTDSSYRNFNDLLAWLVAQQAFDLLTRAVSAWTIQENDFYNNSRELNQFYSRLYEELQHHPTSALGAFVVEQLRKEFANRPSHRSVEEFVAGGYVLKFARILSEQGFQVQSEDLIREFCSTHGTQPTLPGHAQLEGRRLKLTLGMAVPDRETLAGVLRYFDVRDSSWISVESYGELARLYIQCGDHSKALEFLHLMCVRASAGTNSEEIIASVHAATLVLKDFNTGYRRLDLCLPLPNSTHKVDLLLDIAFDSLDPDSKDPFGREVAYAAYREVLSIVKGNSIEGEEKWNRSRAAFQCARLALEFGEKKIARELFGRSRSKGDGFDLQSEARIWFEYGEIWEGLGKLLRIPSLPQREEMLRMCATDLLKEKAANLKLVEVLLYCAEKLRAHIQPSNSLSQRLCYLTLGSEFSPNQLRLAIPDWTSFATIPESKLSVSEARARCEDFIALGIVSGSLGGHARMPLSPLTLEALALRTESVLKSLRFLDSPDSTIEALQTMAQEILAGELPISNAGARYCFEGLCAAIPKKGNDWLLQAARAVQEDLHHPAHRFLPSILHQLVNSHSFAARELLRKLLARSDVPYRMQKHLILCLCKTGYVDSSVRDWIAQNAQRRLKNAPEVQIEGQRAEIQLLRLIFSRGLSPSQEILDFVLSGSDGRALPLGPKSLIQARARLESLKDFQMRFESSSGLDELLGVLTKSPDAPMAYYLLYNGLSQFHLINNYSLTKFRQIVGDIDNLTVEPAMVSTFVKSLTSRDFERTEWTRNLLSGRFPIGKALSVTEVEIKNSTLSRFSSANSEAGAVLGRNQLGVLVKTSLYREFAAESVQIETRLLVDQISATTSLAERMSMLTRIESLHPEWLERGKRCARERIEGVDGKSLTILSLDGVFELDNVSIDVRELLQAIEEQRRTLRQAQEHLLLMLKGQNPKQIALSAKISKKERVRSQFEKGLESKPELGARIAEIDAEIDALKKELAVIGQAGISERYKELSTTERETLHAEEREKLRTVMAKDSAGVFLSVVLDTICRVPFSENDITVAKEVSSHLQSPLQAVSNDEGGIVKTGSSHSMTMAIRYLDKCRHFMSVVRFADSKVCCFSSNNYEVNKLYVASIVRDPLSFVFMLEEGGRISVGGSRDIVKNIGFCFGMFGFGPQKEPAIFLNGIYSALGNTEEIVNAALASIEELLARPLGIKLLHVSALHGGALQATPRGFIKGAISGTRLRALQQRGEPVRVTYDDMGKVVNEEATYSGFYKYLD